MSRLLRTGEWLYCSVNAARRTLYHRGLLRPRRLPRPVISIGNLSVGGAGKTPTVIAVARILSDAGWKPVILTRGYGSAASVRNVLVDEHDPERFGDEPVLMWNTLRDIDVVVGRGRFTSGRWYLARYDCDIFLLDDGFQHLQLHRDIDIVLNDPEALILREWPRALRDADIVLRRTEETSLADSSDTFTASLRPQSVHWHREIHPLEVIRDRRVVAFSGLAHNQRFRRTLEKMQVEVLEFVEFADHHHYTREEVENLRRKKEKSGADLLVTTEKDWVKLCADDIAAIVMVMQIFPEERFSSEIFKLLGSTASPIPRT